MSDHQYTTRRVDKILEQREYWHEFEHGRWKLLSFTGTQSAKFGEMNPQNGQYEQYTTVNASTLRFIRGVSPDVIDNYEETVS